MILGYGTMGLPLDLGLLLRSPWVNSGNLRALNLNGVCHAAPAPTRLDLPTLKRGMRSAAVKTLQEQLNKLGANPAIPQTGFFGELTWIAVSKFQAANQLQPVDGVVGPKTWAGIERRLGSPVVIQHTAPVTRGTLPLSDKGGITPDRLVQNAIRPALKHIGLYSEAAEQLLLGTAIQESLLRHRRQLGKGPARGLFQMEPATHNDIWTNYLAYHKDLASKVSELLTQAGADKIAELENNDLYAAAMARVGYYRKRGPLPAPGDLEGMAQHWKKHWNTDKGKGTPKQFIDNWNLMMGSRQPLPITSTGNAAKRNYRLFGQAEKDWSKDLMAGSTTVQHSGCVITSLAMALRTAGVQVNGKDCTPGVLNSFIKSHDGYTSNSALKWNVPCKLGRLIWQGKKPHTQESVLKQLETPGNALILNVHHGQHWVLVESPAAGGGFVCCDPGSGSGVRKTYLMNEVKDLSVYTVT